MGNDFREMLQKMDLHQIDKLRQAKQAITYLQGKRRKLQEEMAIIDEQISGLTEGRIEPNTVLPKPTGATGTSDGRSAQGPRKIGGALPSKIIAVLQGKTGGMTIPEIADAVLAGGYETRAKGFRVMVGINLGKMQEVERVSRGVYRLKNAQP